MPSVAEKIEQGNNLLQVLAFGKQKTRKTWWAVNAAEAGFNVLLLDGENGWTIAKQLSPAAQKRVQVISLTEQTKKAIFAPFLTSLLKSGEIIWGLDEKRITKLQPTEDSIHINLLNRTSNDVLVIDSWTAVCWSLQFRFALENQIDLSAADKKDWDFYGWGGRLATYFIKQLQTLPCHKIVIGHKTVYEKMTRKVAGKQQEVEYTREQLISTSNPHSLTIGAEFSDILTFRQLSDKVFKIEVSGNESKEGGSRSVPPALYDWEKLQFKDLCLAAGIALPTNENPLWDISFQQPINPMEVKQVIKPNAITTTNKSSLSLNLKSKS